LTTSITWPSSLASRHSSRPRSSARTPSPLARYSRAPRPVTSRSSRRTSLTASNAIALPRSATRHGGGAISTPSAIAAPPVGTIAVTWPIAGGGRRTLASGRRSVGDSRVSSAPSTAHSSRPTNVAIAASGSATCRVGIVPTRSTSSRSPGSLTNSQRPVRDIASWRGVMVAILRANRDPRAAPGIRRYSRS
jgi:hypothetical protein